jgi:hypothetical protein
MGRVTTSSPARDAERRRLGGTVLDAVLERITYANEDTGYTIARVATDRSGADLLTVVGALLGVQPGEPEQPRVFRTGFLLVLCYFLAVQPSVVDFLRCAVSES